MATDNLDEKIGGSRMIGEFDGRLTALERHAISTEKRLDAVDSKLDQIMAVVTKAEAKPAFNPSAVLGFIRDAGVLIGMAGAAIIYISANLNSTPLAVMQTKMETMAKRLDDAEAATGWRPEIADSRR